MVPSGLYQENPLHRTIFHRILCVLPFYLAGMLLTVLFMVSCRGRFGRRGSIRNIRWESVLQVEILGSGHVGVYFVSFLPAFLDGISRDFCGGCTQQVGWTFSGWLTAHHPLVHTGLLCGIFTVVRNLGGSDNLAAAVYSLLQMAVMAGIFTAISRFLRKEHAPVWLQIGTVVHLCLFPFHGMMAVYTTKDTVFAGIFVLCVIQIYRMCTRPENWLNGLVRIMGAVAFCLSSYFCSGITECIRYCCARRFCCFF